MRQYYINLSGRLYFKIVYFEDYKSSDFLHKIVNLKGKADWIHRASMPEVYRKVSKIANIIYNCNQKFPNTNGHPEF